MTGVQEDHVDAVIGAACSSSSVALSYLATAWNIPVVGYTPTTGELSNKAVFNTMVRSTGTNGQVFNALVAICHHYRLVTLENSNL